MLSYLNSQKTAQYVPFRILVMNQSEFRINKDQNPGEQDSDSCVS